MDTKLSELLELPEATVREVLANLEGEGSSGKAQEVLSRMQQKLQEGKEAVDGNDVHKAKAQLQYENARLENEVHRLNKNVGQLKSALDSAGSESAAARAEVQTAKEQLAKVECELQAQRKQDATVEAQQAQLREQLEQLKAEKREQLQQIGERRDQLDESAAEVRRLNEIVHDLRSQRETDQTEIARLRSQTSVADVSEHMLKQSLELAKSQAVWLDEELVKTQTELQQARTELGRAATTGKAETARLRGEIEALTEQTDEQRERNAQLERRLREKLEAERQAKEELAEREEQFRHEMAAQRRLCDEWERTTTAAKQHVRSLEVSLHELEARQRESDANTQEAVRMMEQRVSEAEEARNSAQARVEQLEGELRNANRLLSESAQTQAQLLSPTASAAARIQGAHGSLSITQLYADKLALEDRLRNADAEIGGLRQGMEQILAEIEERGPIIAAERDEHQRLLRDADKIAQDLAGMRQEHSTQAEALKTAAREGELLRRQLAAEQQQTRDLERQVARLLRSAEETRMGGRAMSETPQDISTNPLASPMARRQRAHAQTTGEQDEQWLSDVDRVISQKLVTFGDVTELVAQNRRLLRTTRELAAQAAAHDDDDEVKAALEQAEGMLDRLSAELETAKTRLGAVERERDMLRTLTHRSDKVKEAAADEGEDSDGVVPPPVSESGFSRGRADTISAEATSVQPTDGNSEALAQLQADYDTYKIEARKTRAQLEHETARLQSEASELRVRAARAEAQTEFDADRMQMFARDLEARQKEVDHLRLATTRLHNQTESYERQLESTTQEMTSERVELSRLRRQTALLEAQLETMRQNEQRWRSEEQRMAAERASLTQILDNTTRMRDEWQKSTQEQQALISERLESTRRDADAARQELRQAREETERMRFKFDAELRELRGQIQQRDDKLALLQRQILEGTELQGKLHGERRELELVRDDLQRQVASLEARVQSQEELMQRAQGKGQEVTPDSLLAVQLQDARSQLEALQSESETTSKRAEDYRQISVANERALAELTATYDSYKAEQERSVEKLRSRVTELEGSLDETRTALNQCREELAASTNTAQATESEFQTREAAHTMRIAELENEAAQKSAALEALREDMKRHDGVVQNLQEQYEREIVAHAKDIEGTLLARERLRETQKQLAAATAELNVAKEVAQEQQGAVQEAKTRAAQDVEAAESQLAEIRRQNALLLAHLESLGHRVPDVSVDPEQTAAGAESGGDQAPQSHEASEQGGLRDVVAYLRRERDLAAAQLELAQQESQRWRQQATHTQRMLDETRSELQQYAPADDAELSGLSQQRLGGDVETILAGDGPLTLTSTQRQTCRQQVEQSKLLHESNTVLRAELGTARGRLREVEASLSRVADQEVPQLRSANASLRAELDAARDQTQQLQGMCDHWKRRHENVLAKYEMIEPEEHNALKQEGARLRAELDALKTENVRLQQQVNAAAEQSSTANTRRARQQQAEVSRLKLQLDSQLKELSVFQERYAALEASHQELATARIAEQELTQAAKHDAQEQRTKFDKLHATFQKLRKQSVEKLEQSNALAKSHESTIESLTAQLETLQTVPQPSSDSVDAAPTAAPAPSDNGELERLRADVDALTAARDSAVAVQQSLSDELQQTRTALDQARAELAKQIQSQTQAEAAGEPTGEVAEGAATAPSQDSSAELEKLRTDLAAAEAKAASFEAQLEQIKAKALKYARDNRVLQTKAAELEKKVQELQAQTSAAEPQKELEDTRQQLAKTKKQLEEAEAKIESAQANAKKTAELRSKLQISRATKRAEDLEKQVAALQSKMSTHDSQSPDDGSSLKRPSEVEDGPAKKAHVDS
ncbi:Filament-forming protein [Coemansia sp. RSA 988]|nr:Filament-forming protein [Coemansia sp. RSA 988]